MKMILFPLEKPQHFNFGLVPAKFISSIITSTALASVIFKTIIISPTPSRVWQKYKIAIWPNNLIAYFIAPLGSLPCAFFYKLHKFCLSRYAPRRA